MSYSWERNHGSGIALAMPHRLGDLSTYRLNDLVREISTRPILN